MRRVRIVASGWRRLGKLTWSSRHRSSGVAHACHARVKANSDIGAFSGWLDVSGACELLAEVGAGVDVALDDEGRVDDELCTLKPLSGVPSKP